MSDKIDNNSVCEVSQTAPQPLSEPLLGEWVEIGRYVIYGNEMCIDTCLLDSDYLPVWKFLPQGKLIHSNSDFMPDHYDYTLKNARLYIASNQGKKYGIAGNYRIAIEEDRIVVSQMEYVKVPDTPIARKLIETRRTVLIRYQGEEFPYDEELEQEYERAIAAGALTVEEWYDRKMLEKEKEIFEQYYAEHDIG